VLIALRSAHAHRHERCHRRRLLEASTHARSPSAERAPACLGSARSTNLAAGLADGTHLVVTLNTSATGLVTASVQVLSPPTARPTSGSASHASLPGRGVGGCVGGQDHGRACGQSAARAEPPLRGPSGPVSISATGRGSPPPRPRARARARNDAAGPVPSRGGLNGQWFRAALAVRGLRARGPAASTAAGRRSSRASSSSSVRGEQPADRAGRKPGRCESWRAASECSVSEAWQRTTRGAPLRRRAVRSGSGEARGCSAARAGAMAAAPVGESGQSRERRGASGGVRRNILRRREATLLPLTRRLHRNARRGLRIGWRPASRQRLISGLTAWRGPSNALSVGFYSRRAARSTVRGGEFLHGAITAAASHARESAPTVNFSAR